MGHDMDIMEWIWQKALDGVYHWCFCARDVQGPLLLHPRGHWMCCPKRPQMVCVKAMFTDREVEVSHAYGILWLWWLWVPWSDVATWSVCPEVAVTKCVVLSCLIIYTHFHSGSDFLSHFYSHCREGDATPPPPPPPRRTSVPGAERNGKAGSLVWIEYQLNFFECTKHSYIWVKYE